MDWNDEMDREEVLEIEVDRIERSQLEGNHVEPNKFQRPNGTLAFLLLGVHADPFVEHNQLDELEAGKRGKLSLSGLTIVALDFARPEHVVYRGLCLRTRRPAEGTANIPRDGYIYRDKCCNSWNFDNLIQNVLSSSGQHAGVKRRLPRCAQFVESIYTYNTSLVDNCNSTASHRPNRGFAAIDEQNTRDRYRDYYQKIVEFVLDQCRQRNISTEDVLIYHKLPVTLASWLLGDLAEQFASHRTTVNYCFLHRFVRASNVRISGHCLRRENHNSCICEICLTDEYAPQLLNLVCNRRPVNRSARTGRVKWRPYDGATFKFSTGRGRAGQRRANGGKRE